MIHGPCGILNWSSRCMKNRRCTKNYPRKLVSSTQTGQDGYPVYKRRSINDGGKTAKIFIKRGGLSEEIEIDNSWMVPFCPLLSRVYKSHINVEYCNSVKSIKYICKYINKDSDQAVFKLENSEKNKNEIDDFLHGRYICSNEDIWRILSVYIHERFPNIVHLSVHLENGQRVYFSAENAREKIIRPPETTLTAFFKLCQSDDFAKTLLYCDVPRYYVCFDKEKIFKRRKQGVKLEGNENIRVSGSLGRVYTVYFNNFECFYLRLLLHHVKGPHSFESLKTINGIIYPTYKEACRILGLLIDDKHYELALSEAATVHSAPKLRNLFAILLSSCGLSDPIRLWELNKEHFSKDILIAKIEIILI